MNVPGLIQRLLFVICACALPSAVPAQFDELYSQPRTLIEIAPGRVLNLVCIGEGSPVVIFDSGLAEPASNWFLVQPEVARQTRTCAYDRVGSGFSVSGEPAGSSKAIVDDLKNLLLTAGIAPPYVLVGQSYGGMNMRMFYYTHPQDVAALLLIDPTHEDQTEGFRMLSASAASRETWPGYSTDNPARRECISLAANGFEPGTEAYKQCVFDAPKYMSEALQQAYLLMQQRPPFHRAQLAEELNVFADSVDQLRSGRRGFGKLPVIVLTRSADPKPLRSWETPHLRAVRERLWFNLHQSLADASSRGEHRVVPDSDHSIHLSQPTSVVEAIKQLIQTSRDDLASQPDLPLS